MSTVPILWLHDPTAGDGKSWAGWELLMQTSQAGAKTAYVDLEYLGVLEPAPEDDPGNHQLKIKLLAAQWPAYQADGVQCLVAFTSTGVAGVTDALGDAIPGAAVTTCRTDNADTMNDLPGDAAADLHFDITGVDGDKVAEKIRAAAGNWPFRDLGL